MANIIKIATLFPKLAIRNIVDKGINGKTVNPIYKNGSAGPIKVNSNPNKTPARGERNPTQTKLDNQDRADALENKYPPVKSKTIKINSNKRGN